MNRNGTKAAEATWVAPTFGGVPMFQTVYLDRPFVYAIVDNATGLPLFIGAVTKL